MNEKIRFTWQSLALWPGLSSSLWQRKAAGTAKLAMPDPFVFRFEIVFHDFFFIYRIVVSVNGSMFAGSAFRGVQCQPCL